MATDLITEVTKLYPLEKPYTWEIVTGELGIRHDNAWWMVWYDSSDHHINVQTPMKLSQDIPLPKDPALTQLDIAQILYQQFVFMEK